MKMDKKIIFVLLTAVLLYGNISAQEKRFITVAQDGSGDFKTITQAINSLPAFNYQRTVVNVKNGIYNEKIRIEKDYITIKGESREKTIISYSQLRSDWDAKKDSIGPGIINIYGDDVILEDLTVENTQPEIGPHAFAVYGFGTRTVIMNCSLISRGADTVSLWNNKNGMYYHAGCFFQGAVDFVCPRGWCFIKDSRFYEVKQTASLWHAGGDDIKQKLVIKNSVFDGVEGWELGRHHYEAQFYLIDCKFLAGMSSKPIYRVTYPKEPKRDRPFNWGPRYYFYNCIKEGEKLDWIKDNLTSAEGALKPDKITPAWTFGNKWNPESNEGPKIIKYKIEGNSLLLYFNEKITVFGTPVIKSGGNCILNYESGAGSDTIRLVSQKPVSKNNLRGMKIINESKMIGVTASVKMRDASLKLN
jgi:pectinesterase